MLYVSEGINCQISVVNSTAPLIAVSKTYSATASSYVGDVLSLEGEKGSAADFNHIVATAGTTSVRPYSLVSCVRLLHSDAACFDFCFVNIAHRYCSLCSVHMRDCFLFLLRTLLSIILSWEYCLRQQHARTEYAIINAGASLE